MKEKNCHPEEKTKEKPLSRVKKLFSEKKSLKKGVLLAQILNRPYL